MTQLRIGIDLGGTKTEVILLNGDSETLFRTRVPTLRDDYDGTLEAIAHLVAQAEDHAGASGLPVGVGIPGSVSRKTGLVKNANSTWLNGRPLHADLSRRLSRDVKVVNDANCLAVSEATDGAAAGQEFTFAAILGTGCGAGLAWRGQAVPGPNGVAGEWGHNPLPWTSDTELQSRRCYCGRYGCQETFLSGTGLCLSYERMTGEAITGAVIAERAGQGQRAAVTVVNQYLEDLARGLAAVINVLDPDIIVLGGGVSNMPAIYERMPELLSKYVFGGECDTPVVQAMHGDSSGVRGAAWLNPIIPGNDGVR